MEYEREDAMTHGSTAAENSANAAARHPPAASDTESKMTRWIDLRRDLHAHPELRFEEVRTANIIAGELQSLGYKPRRGLIGTDVIATLPGTGQAPGIILRADIDALPIQETTGLPYRSTVPGKMHACGHDGHTAILLAAAQLFSEVAPLPGDVHFLFQPGEEGGAGAKKLIDAGLLSAFQARAAFGLHNWPGLPVGEFGMRVGPIMAAGVRFKIVIQGRGAHAAQPHLGIDPVPIACSVVLQLQALASRYKDPVEPAVISTCMLSAGQTDNVIPEAVEMRGTIRTLSSAVMMDLQEKMRQIANGIALAHGAHAEVSFFQYYPATVNSAEEVKICELAVRAAFPDRAVHTSVAPNLTSEDFGFMLEELPGAYVLLGAAEEGQEAAALHSSGYDFNDALIDDGARFWVSLAQTFYGAYK